MSSGAAPHIRSYCAMKAQHDIDDDRLNSDSGFSVEEFLWQWSSWSLCVRS